mmetsp:Transcript_57620/g.148235  ORF Transcript_57620/g.148235 Transcript_57620/m.148235 type:complete len:203 (+) Transcript_57620:479-1087(+)
MSNEQMMGSATQAGWSRAPMLRRAARVAREERPFAEKARLAERRAPPTKRAELRRGAPAAWLCSSGATLGTACTGTAGITEGTFAVATENTCCGRVSSVAVRSSRTGSAGISCDGGVGATTLMAAGTGMARQLTTWQRRREEVLDARRGTAAEAKRSTAAPTTCHVAVDVDWPARRYSPVAGMANAGCTWKRSVVITPPARG